MKKTTQPAVAVSLLLGSLIFLGACSSTGMQRSEKTSASMAVVEKDIRLAEPQIDRTGAALAELIRPGQPDAKAAFKKYSANVDEMDKIGTRVLEHADKMSEQGKEYFHEWRKQGNTYNSAEIQALSEQRRADLTGVLAKIPEAGVGVKGAIKAYLSDIKEIRSYLSTDLTDKGIQTITPVAETAVRDGARLKETVQPLLMAIGNARAELAHPGAK